jgi:predicted dienelactone hydrolase
MSQRWVRFACSVVAFALAACAEPVDPGPQGHGGDADEPPSAPEPTDPDEPGPYGVGVDTLRFTDARGKELKVEVWYPADTSNDPEPDPYEEIPITLKAHRSVPSDRRGAPYPVIGFTHGLGGIRFQSASLCEHLASHGFVVISPDHAGHTLFDYLVGFDSSETGRVILERPADVTLSIDHVLGLSTDEAPHLAGIADATRLGIVGHSFGAINTLMIAGADDDLPGLTEWCEENDGNACSYVDKIDFEAAGSTDFADARVTAAVAMSPGAWYAFGPDGGGLAGLPPTRILGGTRDDTLSWETEIAPTYEALTPARYLAELADAGHYGPFSDLCRVLATRADCAGADAGFLDAEAGKAIVHPLVTAFLRRYVVEDESMDAWLQPPFTDGFPALTWSAEP